MAERDLPGSQAPLGNPLPRGPASRDARCSAYADLLVDLSDGELAGDERKAAIDHVAACPACRAELARLDASLAQLKTAFVATEAPAISLSSQSQPPKRLSFAHAATFAAALLMLVGVAWTTWWLVSSSPSPNQVANARTDPPATQRRLSEGDALRQIALIEQQARLQASLDLMPRDAWYASQREENEQILARFQEVTAVSTPSASEHDDRRTVPHRTAGKGETL